MPTASPAAPRLVDAHVHLLPERLSAAIRRFFHAEIAKALVYPHEPQAALACLLAAGVQRCWSLPYVRRAGTASALNRWMAETFAADPVVIPGATLHPADEIDAVLTEALDELRLSVIKLHCSVGEYAPDDLRLDPLWRRVSASGHPVVVHAGHAINGTTTAVEVDAVGRVAQRWPDARIIVAHCSAPAVDATLALLRATRSVYADLTPVVPMLAPVTRAGIAGLERRLLFGSDAPNVAVSIETSVAHIRSLGLDPADEAAVLGGTAE
jgi:hypothetical protein